MSKPRSRSIQSPLTQLLGCDLPIIAGPMFLVSNEVLVASVSNGGGVGGMPSLNWRTTAQFRDAVRKVKSLTSKPYAVNLIVNQSNPRQAADLAVCVEEKVPMIITSLGNPKETIQKMHSVGSKVFCDVTTLKYAQKVQDLGADGVIAVSSGAGGHAGAISPLVLIPYLRKHLKILIIAAGGISTGEQIAATFLLGADGVQVGTRFIASEECKVEANYKTAILNSVPEDIVLTKKISGTPIAVINTDFIKQQGLELNPIEEFLLKDRRTKKYVKMLKGFLGSRQLRQASSGVTSKQVWSAGQGVGLIDEVLSCEQIMAQLVDEYYMSIGKLTKASTQA